MERYVELHNPIFPNDFKLRRFDASDLEIFNSRYAPSGLCLTGCSYFVSFFFKSLTFA